ncbi:DUF6844 domain-containing protein [Stutzerimonas nitrititolerans]|uniref:DUF6844 domain-containing protein n=1 Tax=Stutzerimonas nitrititolerans TaxID=2482751 RepID=UPI000F796B08|nr:hypothetical protein [Stutzerimonas nitrititolerans]MBA1235312.1 hypothetical protein [Stutzerimonas stutzeri]RRV19693.1 hypothetical protein EGJ29_16790 [Pseudomonas sp. s199]
MKMMFTKTALTLAFAAISTFSLPIAAQATTEVQPQQAATPQLDSLQGPEQDALEAEIAAASAPEPMDPGTELMEQVDNWLSGGGAGLAAKAERGDVFLGQGFAVVKASPDSRDWADHRIMAYKEALMSAQSEFIQWEGIRARAETVSRFFDAREDRSQMPTFEPEELQNTSKLAELLDKVLAVAGGKLDEQLRELGIDPEEFQAAPAEKRALLFENSINEKIAVSARASLTGLVPVKTFEAHDADGNHAIAVVVVASDKMRQFVHDMKSSRGDMAPDPKRASPVPLREQFAADKQALIKEFGIRKMFDENGYPVLISFGQSGTGYTGSDFSQKMDARKGAFLYAQADAYANFAYLLNSTGTAELETTRASRKTTEGIATLEKGGAVQSEESRMELVKRINNEIAARGSISDLPGTRQLLRWTAKHPQYGNEINGVVYIWHPVAEQSARDMRNFTPQRASQDRAEQVRESSSGSAGTSQSRDLMSADDF